MAIALSGRTPTRADSERTTRLVPEGAASAAPGRSSGGASLEG